MNPFALLLELFTNLSERTLAFIGNKNELTPEEEDQRQKQKAALADLFSGLRQHISEVKTASDEELEQSKLEAEARANTEALTEQKPEILELLRKTAEKRREYTESELLPELTDARYQLNSLLNDRENTPIRKNALRMLKKELDDAFFRACAYLKYVERYIKNIESVYDTNAQTGNWDDMPVSFVLPEKWSYNGRLTLFAAEELDFDHVSGTGFFLLHNALRFNYVISDADRLRGSDRKQIAVFQTGFDRENYRAVFSVTAGEYLYACRNGAYGGLPATVKRYEKNTAILTYGEHTELTLSAERFTNWMRYPSVSAEITVYPLNEAWDSTNNRWVFRVSQRPEDAELTFCFDEIPMLLPPEKCGYFIDYWESHGLSDACMDTKIAPYPSDAAEDDLSGVKIQFGEEYIIQADLQRAEDGSAFYLVFNRFLEADEKIAPEEIFAPFSAEITVIPATEQQMYDNADAADRMNMLCLTLMREFRRQRQLQNSREGTRYFKTWEQVTERLKYCLEAGDCVTCRIKGTGHWAQFNRGGDNLGDVIRYTVADEDLEKLQAFRQANERYPDFFTELNGLRITAVIVNRKEYDIEIQIPKGFRRQLDTDTLLLLPEIRLIHRENPVPERRQLFALYQYNVGALAEPDMQTFLLNPKSITSNRTETEAPVLFNERLRGDEAQYNALLRCMAERRLFLIQGPPGTGKTTVIRELIYQTVRGKSDAKILIVSQANVAVDNVLKGLAAMEIAEGSIIRCGRTEKLQPEIVKYSYEKKRDDYLAALDVRAGGDTRTAELAQKWQKTVQDRKNAPEIGELLLRSHNIIGVTCVGLGQRGIGIDKIDFDLVIVDEAAKALAPELLIPVNRAKKVLMIGDQNQLPAVVNPVLYDEEKIELDDRKYCKNVLFEKSLFERLYTECPDSNKTVLVTQYRMPEKIGTLINGVFYGNMLKNADVTKHKEPLYSGDCLTLVDMSYEERYAENDRTGSPENAFEAAYVCMLLRQIRAKCGGCRIAVITPYKGQKRLIRRRLINSADLSADRDIAVDTIDAFQGDEAEIVIFCTTRSKKRTSFFKDSRRLNVAFSRAKNEMIVIGSGRYLDSYPAASPVHKIVAYIRQNGTVVPNEPLREDIPYRELYDIVTLGETEVTTREPYDEDAVAEECAYYLKNNRFSAVPVAEKKEDGWVFTENSTVYYAARQLSVGEIRIKKPE